MNEVILLCNVILQCQFRSLNQNRPKGKTTKSQSSLKLVIKTDHDRVSAAFFLWSETYLIASHCYYYSAHYLPAHCKVHCVYLCTHVQNSTFIAIRTPCTNFMLQRTLKSKHINQRQGFSGHWNVQN